MIKPQAAKSDLSTHMFCACWDGLRKPSFLMAMPAVKQRYFAQFITTWEKQVLVRVIGIQKKTKANHTFFRDN